MSHVYKKAYTNKVLGNVKGGPLLVPNGKMTCFQIGMPYEGFLERLVVWQASGTSCAFTVELLDSQVPYPPGSYTPGAAPADNLIAYRVQNPPTAALSASAGGTVSLADDNYGMGFRNQDGNFTSPQRYLYLLINPTTPGTDTTWNVFLQARTEVG